MCVLENFAEKWSRIEAENMILLHKLQDIMRGKDSGVNISEPFRKGSLNEGHRRRKLLRIMHENEVLLLL